MRMKWPATGTTINKIFNDAKAKASLTSRIESIAAKYECLCYRHIPGQWRHRFLGFRREARSARSYVWRSWVRSRLAVSGTFR